MSEHWLSVFFYYLLLSEMSGQEQHIIHYGTGIFIIAKKYILLKRNKIKGQYDFYSRVGFFC